MSRLAILVALMLFSGCDFVTCKRRVQRCVLYGCAEPYKDGRCRAPVCIKVGEFEEDYRVLRDEVRPGMACDTRLMNQKTQRPIH